MIKWIRTSRWTIKNTLSLYHLIHRDVVCAVADGKGDLAVQVVIHTKLATKSIVIDNAAVLIYNGLVQN